MTKNYLLILAIIHICNGQVSDYLDANFLPRHVAEEITKNPLVSVTTHAYANAFAAAVNSITWVPYAVARALGPAAVPSLNSPINNGDAIDKFIVDFNKGSDNEDAVLSIDLLLTKYGYSVDSHEVVTEDGYVLTMFRIPNNGTAVFLMHGLLGSADDFVMAGRESGLAYLLADLGFDVWMGNARGNKHSRRHIKLEPSEAVFWDFSWHEIGLYDLPAMIDYVLNETDQVSLKYIGHSQGTTSFFVMASEKPEYNEKVSLMIALSPVAYMSNVRSPIVRLVSPGTPILHGFSQSLGLYEFLPDNNLIRTLKLLMCGTGVLAEILCSNTLFLVFGLDFEQLNVTNLPVIYGHQPSGASVKQIVHFGQGLISNDFRKFDYGSAGNIERYGVETPPSYALENVVAPVSLFFCEEDWLADPKDVDRLYKRLGNVVDLYKVPFEQFNHADFLIAKDVKTLVYKRVLKVLTSF